jgi:hypothetical protein
MRGILRSRLCQEAPFEDEFDLIETKYRGVNKQINFKNLDKNEVEVLTMHEQILFGAKF